MPAAYHSLISNFLNINETTWLTALNTHHQTCMQMPADGSQQLAWHNCFHALQDNLRTLIKLHPEATSWTIIFEYELPRERGRRPDVIILADDKIIILEFKDYSYVAQAHLDQVSAYARDISNYHAASHDRLVEPVLILTQTTGRTEFSDGVYILSPDSIPAFLSELPQSNIETDIDPNTWLSADYAPLPSLVNAARSIFQHEPLPYIRRAQSAGIPETIHELLRIADQAQAKSEHHLALVTGVPGAGKTLVGLQFVYQNHFNDEGSHRTAVFLSGNGPLVTVLQHALKSRIFVQDVYGFLKQYGGMTDNSPSESIMIFDEAQRAWDSQRVKEKRGHATSEPQDFLTIGAKKPWSLMIGLIGDGQEIHLGEEAGLAQWNDAIAQNSRSWYVHLPNHVSHIFQAAHQIKTSESLNLTTSLRSHIASDVQLWIRQLLDGELENATATADLVLSQNFDMYLTNDLRIAQGYVLERYFGQFDKRYGYLASSKANNLEKFGIYNGYNWTNRLKVGPWYNDSPESSSSCCQLREVATEFQCQGLELDFPIISWGDDLVWQENHWISRPSPRSKAHDPHQLRLNSYRVLLSRGRDGFIVFVPPEPSMKSTFDALQQAGLSILVDK